MLQIYSTQDYLECVGKLQDHYDALEDIRNDFLTQDPSTTQIECLQDQLEAVQVCPSLQLNFNALQTEMLFLARFLLTLSIFSISISFLPSPFIILFLLV